MQTSVSEVEERLFTLVVDILLEKMSCDFSSCWTMYVLPHSREQKDHTHLQSVEHKDNSKRRVQVSNHQLYLEASSSQIVCEMLKWIIVPHA